MASGQERIRVVVFGATGSGKTTFVNLASGSNFVTSHSLESCTSNVQISTFSLDGRAVDLIDTPGFDDTVRSDTDVLKSITEYLVKSYSEGTRISGVIYMHRISDNKMSGPSRKNLLILRDICGDENLRNVLLVTNMWSEVPPHVGEARELELASKENFFKPAIDKGARMLRHDNSPASAHAIIRQLAGRKPSTLLVEDEMVNKKKELAQTTVGAGIMRELEEKAERHAAALDELCLGIEAATLEENEEKREILQEEAKKEREKIEQIWDDLEQMATNFAAKNLQLENENRRYQRDFRKQKADAEYIAQLFERERRARELAEAGKRRAEEELAAEREGRGRDRASERQEDGHREQLGRMRATQDHERQEKEGQERERQDRENREKERQERERQERENREKERQEHERQVRVKMEQEHRKKERELRDAAEHARKEKERVENELKRLENEKAQGSRCLIQ